MDAQRILELLDELPYKYGQCDDCLAVGRDLWLDPDEEEAAYCRTCWNRTVKGMRQ